MSINYKNLIKNQKIKLKAELIDTYTLEKRNSFLYNEYKDLEKLNKLKTIELFYQDYKEDYLKNSRRYDSDVPFLDKIYCKTSCNKYPSVYSNNVNFDEAVFYNGNEEIDELVNKIKDKYCGFYYDFGWNSKDVIKFNDSDSFFKPTFLKMDDHNEIGIEIHTSYHTLCSVKDLEILLVNPKIKKGSNIKLVTEEDLINCEIVDIEIPVRPW